MKIIQPGNLERMDATRRFTCEKCGCVWDASSNEYTREWGLNDDVIACVCPTCGRRSYDSKRIVEE